MSFLRALRAYIGLAPDEEIEGRYLYELDARRRELDLRDQERLEAASKASTVAQTVATTMYDREDHDSRHDHDDLGIDGVGRWKVDFGRRRRCGRPRVG